MITIYTSKIKLPGCARGPIILIRPEYRNDKGLLEHERRHVLQWLIVSVVACAMIGVLQPQLAALGMTAHGLLYRFSRRYRLMAEVDAFREQLKHYQNDQTQHFAKMLTEDRYDLRITAQDAERLLRS